ncbi:glycoside hydrolase family 26 protein [Micromonospora siamensis]|uniref:glycoside hydrolase family 26 protein n=1 Tax=Micromonospora siamensis TaxID=299152 RepID=UPI001E2B6804|nr:glycosyl hydrolase [Micromonospora siamensis]
MTWQITLLVLVLAVVAGAAFLVLRGRTGQSGAVDAGVEPGASVDATRSPNPPTPFPPKGKVFLGIQTEHGPYDFTPLSAYTEATGHRPAAFQFAQGWAHNPFDRAVFDRVAERNMLPIVAWEPWDYLATGRARSHGEQPAYRLSRIAGGDFDEYIRSWAQGLKSLGYPVGMRFAHEMNGFWYPWCEQSNGNREGDYVRAYRHVHDIFRQVGVTNVIWVWSANVTYPGAEPLTGLYPGDRYVDWVGLSGYYGTAGVERYRSFDRIFDDTLDQVRRFTRKPIVITETGASDAEGRRAAWIREMFSQLPRHPDVIGVIWFETNKELDWRLSVTPDAARLYGEKAAAARYRVTWSTNTVPRRTVTAPRR